MLVLGIDVGGSGIKGAPVDVDQGIMLTERYRIPTRMGWAHRLRIPCSRSAGDCPHGSQYS